jgi:hypothetical protein
MVERLLPLFEGIITLKLTNSLLAPTLSLTNKISPTLLLWRRMDGRRRDERRLAQAQSEVYTKGQQHFTEDELSSINKINLLRFCSLLSQRRFLYFSVSQLGGGQDQLELWFWLLNHATIRREDLEWNFFIETETLPQKWQWQ